MVLVVGNENTLQSHELDKLLKLLAFPTWTIPDLAVVAYRDGLVT